MVGSRLPHHPTNPQDSNPEDIHVACRRIQESLGCTEERALDLLYGIAVSQGGGLYELAHILAQSRNPGPYVQALERYHVR